MKTIEFPVEKTSDYCDMLSALIGSNNEGGFTIDEVRMGIKILDKLQQKNSIIELEDAEYVFAKGRVVAARWKVASSDVVQFVDCIVSDAAT